ncbi:MAG: class I SAM-dependent methyltransferase [Candidatus Woesebacteria bacterium]|nr:MAG: class I SAM-dependent methyltransferase [Candidatus Woesebacteria bacterium]
MLKKWTKYLCDPVDKSPLKIVKIIEKKGNDVIAGTLKSKSGRIYQIKDGIPILLNRYTQSVKSVASFAYEWDEFDFDYGKKSWLTDIVKPTLGSTKFFKNKTIIDCGSGSGRQSLWMSQAGAKLIFSLELSNASRTTTKRVAEMSNGKVFVIQCDISNPPVNVRTVKVDLIYCVNVIQHTKNVNRAVMSISKLMNKSTDFIFNIYLVNGREKFLKFLGIVRIVTKLIPHALLKYLSFVLAVFSFLLSNVPPMGNWLKKSLPLKHGFKETWLDIYDILGSHEYQKFYSEKELLEILDYSKLDIKKRSRYAMMLNKR